MSLTRLLKKKWILIFSLVILACVLFLYGFIVGKFRVTPYQLISESYYQSIHLTNEYLFETGVATMGTGKKGFWKRMRDRQKKDRLRQAQKGNVRGLQGLGYLSGTTKAPDKTGVVVHDSTAIDKGYNLVVSGHGPEALLLDMNGNIQHRWKVPWQKAFPDKVKTEGVKGNYKNHWRKVHLYPNGDLLAIFSYLGVVKIDKDSNVIWSKQNGAHHDMWVTKEGKIYVLTAKSESRSNINKTENVITDYITVLSSSGKKLNEFSILDAIIDSHYSSMMNFTSDSGDILHTNSIQIIQNAPDNLKPAFKDGNILISFRNNDCLAVVEVPENEVGWALCGMSTSQHAGRLLDNGNILFFDNIGHRGWSKVVEFQPENQKIVWGYYGNEKNGFVSQCCGENYRLANGNTLIVESEPGRAFEVTPSGNIIWEFYSPYRTGKSNELVATLFDLTRHEPQYVKSWLDS